MKKIVFGQSVANAALLCVVAALLSACGTKRSSVAADGALVKKSQTSLIADVVANGLKYETISGKMDLELLPAGAKSGLKTGAYVKLIHDSILQLSIRPFLGMEVLRLSITPDSLLVVDRMNKKYAAEDINSLRQSHGAYFNYYNLQALLTNSLFLPGKRQVDDSSYGLFDVDGTDDMCLLRTADRSGILYNFAVNSSDRIASTLILSPEKNYTLQWSYSSFVQEKESGYVYPTQMQANADINRRRFDLRISYSKLDINARLSMDNSIPGKYVKVPLSELFNALMKMK
jgi:hypothetical protein